MQLIFIIIASIFIDAGAFNAPHFRSKGLSTARWMKREDTKVQGRSAVLQKISTAFNLDSIVAAAPETSTDLSYLPDSFEDAIERAAKCTVKSVKSGLLRVRIDFDTSIGDMTYTSLKNSLPFMKRFSKSIATLLELSPIDFSPVNPEELPVVETRTLRVFFPDMGAAVLARRDWKMGSNDSEVPLCMYTANIQNDAIEDTDKAVIILCPLYSEADYVGRIADTCLQRNIPCIMINPNLINGDQGLGVRKYRRMDVLH